MKTWCRHVASKDPRFHAVSIVVSGGSVMTRCNGRWPERDAVEEADEPPLEQRCLTCDTRQRASEGTHERFDMGGDA